jgi:hypothetical protein
METKHIIFLATSILMLKDDCHANIDNTAGKDQFKTKFKIYRNLLEELYGISQDTPQKK